MEGMRKEGWMDRQKGVMYGERDGGNEEGWIGWTDRRE